jgi:hypothetical protein
LKAILNGFWGALNTIVGWVLEIAPNPPPGIRPSVKVDLFTVIKKNSNTRLLILFFNYLDPVVL